MAGAVARCLLRERMLEPENVLASARTTTTLDRLADLGIPAENTFANDNVSLVRRSDILVLGVKPQMASDVLSRIADDFDPSRHLLVSLLAGVTASQHADALGQPNARIIRVIPTMAAQIGQSCSLVVAGDYATSADVAWLTRMLEACGSVEVLDSEPQLDIATAVLLPTFTMVALEALADAAVLEGLPRPLARRLAARSVHSAASLALHSKDHPAALRNAAESPGGVTIRATRELEQGGYRAAIMNAISVATDRSRELGK